MLETEATAVLIPPMPKASRQDAIAVIIAYYGRFGESAQDQSRLHQASVVFVLWKASICAFPRSIRSSLTDSPIGMYISPSFVFVGRRLPLSSKEWEMWMVLLSKSTSSHDSPTASPRLRPSLAMRRTAISMAFLLSSIAMSSLISDGLAAFFSTVSLRGLLATLQGFSPMTP